MTIAMSAGYGSVAVILLPLAGALLALLWRRAAAAIGLLSALGTLLAAVQLAVAVRADGAARYAIGGWRAPLGIDLYADGLSVVMLLMTAAVGLGVSVYARGYFRDKPHQSVWFWPLWLWLWTALNALFLSSDIFNIYVTLEMIGLAAVALAALAGGADALAGALRYLLVSLLGSLCYLLGVALLYHAYGSVDLRVLAAVIDATPATHAALGLMTAGLMLKTAVFPLHFWLPPAHASAPAPVSALLSALVVKASFYLLLRLWLELFAAVGAAAMPLLGLLGAAAVLWGSWQALIQARLKLLIAYSTVAQIGYLLIAFALAAHAPAVWNGAVYFALSHALAKAAMFLAAGNILLFGGHDRITGLDRLVQRLPLSLAAFALAGVSIIGLPPSGGFIGKWLLLDAAIGAGRWWLVVVMILGSLMAAGYVFKVLGYAFTPAETSREPGAVPATLEWVAVGLALGAILLGFVATQTTGLLTIGEPFAATLPEHGA